jgi:outer membrane protein OmpA-like peptidoglycan-associated protein
VEPQPLSLARGSNSRERVTFARRVVEAARVAGAHLVVPDDMRTAEQNLDTASKIVKNEKHSSSADHLAYVAEMLARRGEYLARRGDVDRWLPGMRIERARLAQTATETQAARELQSRAEAQRQAAELRQRLEAEATTRQLQADELARLREQVAANEQRLQVQVNEDRDARIAAETRLGELRGEYERALATPGSLDEVEALRRRVEDQQRMLQALEEREALSQQTASVEVAELRRQLQQERQFGNADIAQREEELRLRTEELERLRVEREAALARREESERVYESRIADLERARQEAVAQTARLQEQVDQERARADAAQAELQKARSEAAEATRVAEFQRQLAAIAQTRAEDRGIIVTLPGIYFDTGKSTLKSGAKNILSRISSQLKANPSASVIIEGHTDSVGSEMTNRRLSTARAEAVREYLVSEGVPSTRFTVVGHGESAPIATNDTAAGRQQNRRVELVFTTPEMTAGR